MDIIPVFIPFYGCQQKCVYCNQNAITGLNVADILTSAKEQIELWTQRVKNPQEVAFYGGTFTNLPDHIRMELYKLAMPYKIRFSTCPDSINEHFFNEIKANNISTIELGVQSLSDIVLQKNKRGYNASYVRELISKLSSYKINVGVQMMVGMHGESIDEFFKSVSMLAEIKADLFRIYPTLILKDTELYEMYERSDYVPLSVADTLFRTSLYYVILYSNGAKPARVGLPPEINNTDAVYGGFWHPAMGDLIKTFIIYCFVLYYRRMPDIKGNGYKGILGRFSNIVREDGLDMQMVCKMLRELYFESAQRFIKKQGLTVASEFCRAADIG